VSEAEHPEDEQHKQEQGPETPEQAPAAAGEPEAPIAPGEPEAPVAGPGEGLDAPRTAPEALAAQGEAEGSTGAPAETPAGAPAETPAAAPAEPPAAAPAEPPAAAPAEPPAGTPADTPAAARDEEELEEVSPREKPEIPGADLIPDIVPEGEEFLDAEAAAAAEAEAEAAAEQVDQAEEDAQPIADATIDLAAGARYTATGKRKTSVARVILKPGSGTYSVNDKPLEQFFPRETLQRMIRQPLETVGYDSRMDVVARMHGGGVSSQAGALRHGISRALIVADPHLRGELKRRGFLTRDPRVKERKKAGLKKARKRPQFSKR
jgi:small subunit ribosomal protein S9